MRQNVFKRKGGRREGGGGRKNRVEPLAGSSVLVFFFFLSSKGLSEAFEKLRELTVSVDEAPSSGKALSHDGT